MTALNALAGGVFGSRTAGDDESDLRRLVEDLGTRAFNARRHPRNLPEEFDETLWNQLEQTGLSRLTSTPELVSGPADLAVVLYGLARHAAAVPIAETDLMAAWLGQHAGLTLPDGPLTVAIADVDARDGRITGTADNVPWTRASQAVVLAARSGTAFHVSILDGSEIEEHYNIAGEPRDRITFDLPIDGFTSVDPAVGQELLRRGAWARCVQAIGALDAAAELSVAHTRERIQFGRPLSAFQAVQHALASMAAEIDRSRAATTFAVTAACDFGYGAPQTDYAVSIATIVACQVVPAVCTIAHQLHGAIGVTLEHPLGLFTMRAQSALSEFGTSGQHARRLGQMALAADDVWDVIIGSDVSGWS